MSELTMYLICCLGAAAIVFGNHWWKMRALRQLEASHRRFEAAFVAQDQVAMARERELQDKLERRAR